MSGGIYSGKQTSFIFNGVRAVGLADDNAFTISHPEDGYTFTQGLDNFVVASENPDALVMATVRLLHTSWYNNYLNGYYNLQRVNPATAFKSFLFKDLQGTDTVTSDQALITKVADIVTSRDVPVREWQIAVISPIQVGGGQIPSPFPII